MSVVYARDLLNRVDGKIRNYSEFLLLMNCANVMKDLGLVLDISDIELDQDMLSEQMILFLKNMVSAGYVVGFNIETGFDDTEKSIYYVSTDKMDDISDIVVEKDINGVMTWVFDSDYFDQNTKKFEVLIKEQVVDLYNTTLYYVLAHFIVKDFLSRVAGDVAEPNILFNMMGMWAGNEYYYLGIYGLTESMMEYNIARQRLLLSVKGKQVNAAKFSYKFFLNSSLVAGKFRLSGKDGYSAIDKRKFLDDMGIEVGSIVALYSLTGTQNSTHTDREGKIVNTNIIRIDDITDTKVKYTALNSIHTLEDAELQRQDEAYAILSVNNLSTRVSARFNQSVDLYHTGVGFYLNTSDIYVIEPLTTYTVVSTPLRIDGVIDYHTILEIDCLYWALSQRTQSIEDRKHFDFDRVLYKKMYSGGRDLLWDVCNRDQDQ